MHSPKGHNADLVFLLLQHWSYETGLLELITMAKFLAAQARTPLLMPEAKSNAHKPLNLGKGEKETWGLKDDI